MDGGVKLSETDFKALTKQLKIKTVGADTSFTMYAWKDHIKREPENYTRVAYVEETHDGKKYVSLELYYAYNYYGNNGHEFVLVS